MSPLQSVKLSLVGATGLAKDALHVYVGLLVFFGCVAVLHRRIGEGRPLLVVVLVALAGEAWDLRDTIAYHTPLRLWGNWHDIWNTCFWPAVLTALARWTTLLRR